MACHADECGEALFLVASAALTVANRTTVFTVTPTTSATFTVGRTTDTVMPVFRVNTKAMLTTAWITPTVIGATFTVSL